MFTERNGEQKCDKREKSQKKSTGDTLQNCTSAALRNRLNRLQLRTLVEGCDGDKLHRGLETMTKTMLHHFTVHFENNAIFARHSRSVQCVPRARGSSAVGKDIEEIVAERTQ